MNLSPPTQTVRAQLSLWDAVSIIVGIVIGAGIYETPPQVFKNVSGPWAGLGIWALAGLLCLVGALCYAELASTYPRVGGDYFYLTRAYGPPIGFLYGWAQLAVVQTANIGMMAFVFADYAAKLWGYEAVYYALVAVAVLSLINILGIVLGKTAQNLLTAAKVLGLGGIVAAGLFWGQSSWVMETHAGGTSSWFSAALIPVFFTYGGWNDAAFVAAEVRNPRRNIPLALIGGTLGITLIYLLVNAAYLMGLGFEGVRESQTVAADVLRLPLGGSDLGFQAMCILVMVSALGAVNGLILTSSRIYAALGSEHSIFARLGHWNPRLGSPVWSLTTQAVIALVMIAAVGSETGQQMLDGIFTRVGLKKVSWEGLSGFFTLLKCTAPVFWFFFLLSALSLFVLRERDHGMERAFSVPLFPLIPLIFTAMCAYMLYSGIDYAQNLGWVGASILLPGLPLYLLSKKRASPGEVV